MLFKMVFVKHPGLLKRLVTELLGIQFEIYDFQEISLVLVENYPLAS
jgi:hypothetical protein